MLIEANTLKRYMLEFESIGRLAAETFEALLIMVEMSNGGETAPCRLCWVGWFPTTPVTKCFGIHIVKHSERKTRMSTCLPRTYGGTMCWCEWCWLFLGVGDRKVNHGQLWEVTKSTGEWVWDGAGPIEGYWLYKIVVVRDCNIWNAMPMSIRRLCLVFTAFQNWWLSGELGSSLVYLRVVCRFAEGFLCR